MDRLVFGMHHLNISQVGTLIDGKPHYSHPNAALDLCGQDSGEDFFWNKEADTCFYCSGAFGTKATGNTRFFVSCDYQGKQKKVMCADGKERVVTLAMTHSGRDFQLYKIYEPNELMYSEGVQGKATGFHIHLEVAEGSVKTKYWDDKLKVYRMKGEMNPVNAFFILDGFTTVVNTQGLKFKHCDTTVVKQATDTADGGKEMSTADIIKKHCNDFNVNDFPTKLKSYGGYKSYVKSLGGVFSKYADFTGKITKASELTEVGQYVCGLLSIWGVDYATGSSGGGQGNWWKNDKPASEATDAFYPRSQDNGGKKNYLHEKIDDVLSDTSNYKIGMVVDCETGVDMIRFKAGIYSGKESYDFRGMVQNGGKIITKMKDLQVGDIVQYYIGCTFPDKSPSKIVSTFGYIGHKNDNNGKGWFHVNIVGEVDTKANTITTYDTGHAFTNSGEYKITVSRDASCPYKWASDWVAVRPVNLVQDAVKNGWEYKDKKWYFYDNGELIKGWKKIKWKHGTDWFFFDKNGVMQTGWKKLGWSKGENWFYFTEDGAMVTGWQFLSWSGGSNWFYFNSDGVMQTGLQYVDWKGKKDWYLFDSNGAMQTGKQKAEIVLSNSGALTGGKKIG